jgi:hypothetical protein
VLYDTLGKDYQVLYPPLSVQTYSTFQPNDLIVTQNSASYYNFQGDRIPERESQHRG